MTLGGHLHIINNTLPVIATLQVAITGKVKLLIYCALPCVMRFWSLADFAGRFVGFLNVFSNTCMEPPLGRLVIL